MFPRVLHRAGWGKKKQKNKKHGKSRVRKFFSFEADENSASRWSFQAKRGNTFYLEKHLKDGQFRLSLQWKLTHSKVSEFQFNPNP